MAKAALKSTVRKRTASKEERQVQLIQATIRSVATRGLSDTTMATVASEAGLSQGIINLHFQSKERLLVETLRFIADEYRESWERALAGAGNFNANRMVALVEVDFRLPVCDRNKLAVWFAFWGESKSRPTYRQICAERDRAYRNEMIQVCQALIDEGGYRDVDPESVTSGLSAMSAGLWLDLLTSPRAVSRADCRRITMQFLATSFPAHFTPEGPIVRDREKQAS